MATAKKTDTKVRVLVDGQFGKVDEVVTLTPELLEVGLAVGQVDPAPEAVAYAESLVQG
jgi:hypothetical protein